MKYLLILFLLIPSLASATTYYSGSSSCEAAFSASMQKEGLPVFNKWYKLTNGKVAYVYNGFGSPNPSCLDPDDYHLKFSTTSSVLTWAVSGLTNQGCSAPLVHGYQRSANSNQYTSTIEQCPGYADTDGDGVPNALDACPSTAPADIGLVDSTGCVPPPAEPPTCFDGVVSGEETGIDCGDPACSAPDDSCTAYCPDGFDVINEPVLGEMCTSNDDTPVYTVLAKLGVCPDDFFMFDEDGFCRTIDVLTLASSDYLDPVPVPAPVATPWNNVFTDQNTVLSNSAVLADGVLTETVTSITTGTVAGSPDASTTETTTTVTAVDGSKTETTVIDSVAKTPSGAVTGGTTTITKTYAPDGTLTGQTTSTDAIESSEGAGAVFQSPVFTDGFEPDAVSLDLFAPRFQTFIDSIESAPIYSPVANLFAGPDVSGKSPTFSLGFGSYGSKEFLLSQYDSVWSAIGILFMFLATVASARLVLIKGAS